MAIKNIRLGEVLIEYGYITDEQLLRALDYQKEHKGELLGGILVSLGFITEKQMIEALAMRLQLKTADLSSLQAEIEIVRLVPKQLAKKYNILAISKENQIIKVVTSDPLNFYAIEDVRQITGCDLELELAEATPLSRSIDYYYAEVSAMNATKAANTSIIDEEPEEIEIDAVDDDADAPIIKLLSSLIQRANSINASDIHIEPFENITKVRMRIDGTITEYVDLQKSLHSPLIAHVKILGDLDIAERRIPQDGHFRVRILGENVNVRVSVIPTVWGEKAVLRILSGNARIDNPGRYGMNEANFAKFSRMLKMPNGIIYITGPTGSGKSTTLYMALEDFSDGQYNISTIEDPVEKNIVRINQMQVNNIAGLTFEAGLRALLRQDPDIIMVGETRDAETASISIRAAITGHLVLSTLHTNNAASTVLRLVDMGVEPYMIASSLNGVVAQRLVRRVCPYCSVEDAPTETEARILGSGITKVRRERGCARCNETGFSGRTAIHEILVVDTEMRRMITTGASVDEINDYAINKQGMVTLLNGGLELIKEGKTTVSEVLKVAYYY